MKYELQSCVWEFTLSCNLNCIHCGSSAGKKREYELTTDEAINLCYELKKAGCLSVALMGGEPFLRKDFFTVAEKIKELGMELCVITNGTVYNDSIFENLKKLKLQALATSIDGAKAETHDMIRGVKGAFDKTLRFIDKALEYDLPVSVITTVSKLNISELNDIKNIIINRNIAWQIQTAGAEGNRFKKEYLLDEEEFYAVGLFIQMLRDNYSIKEMPVIGAHDIGYNSCVIKDTALYDKWPGCQAGITVVGIRSNGDVMGCLSLNNDRFVEGNVRERNFYDIWNDENLFSYNRKFDISELGENCRNCVYSAECKGGCNEMSFMKTGKLHNDPYCFYKIEKEKFNYFEIFYYKFKSKLKSNKTNLNELGKIFTGKRI